MKIESNWRITFDPGGTPLVLLAYGDEIEGEPRYPLGRGLEVVALVDAAAPFLRPTGNSAINLKLDIYKPAASDAAARAEVLDSLIAVNVLGRKPLKIEVLGITDRYWLFANCYIPTYEPGRSPEGPPNIHLKSYSLTCTGFSRVGP